MRTLACCLSVLLLSAAAHSEVLEEVVVTATLRKQILLDAPISITVLDESRLRGAERQHFEDVLGAVPNLNWAAGTSRPRFFQIRGIGEREQWEGAPNSSVGFIIDDIDFSGVGMAATLFDVDRIEVLRGPQGLRYGANALAGLILVRSRDPSEVFELSTEAAWAEYDTSSAGLTASAPIESLDSAWRLAVQRYRSDGFRENAFLDREDVNDRDELTARAKWRWRPSETTTVDIAFLHADLDNGYDGWSIDNSRRSLADRPGKDAQEADGASLRLETQLTAGAQLTVIAAGADSDAQYSFDGDWGNAESWAPYTYDYFFESLTSHRTRSLEARVQSPDAEGPGAIAWLIGVYGLRLTEHLEQTSVGEYVDPDFPEYSGVTDDAVSSDFEADTLAAFAQVDGWFTDHLGWSFGLRGEQRDSQYGEIRSISGAAQSAGEEQRDRMWGGQATLHFDLQPETRLFATVSRGYKAGGFNLGFGAAYRARFAPEYLWSIDVGARREWLDGRLYVDVTTFYMHRRDMQVSTGLQLDPGDPNSYVFFTDNAARGRNYGLESTLRWRLNRDVEAGAALGLLRTRYEGYAPEGVDLSDREQAYAPEYQFSVYGAWRHPTGWMARVDINASDDFYFDVPPNPVRARAYALTHLKLGYERERWGVYLYGRNVFDEDYAMRGFYFGNEPPNFENRRYIQLGEPRQVGVSARWEF